MLRGFFAPRRALSPFLQQICNQTCNCRLHVMLVLHVDVEQKRADVSNNGAIVFLHQKLYTYSGALGNSTFLGLPFLFLQHIYCAVN